MTFTFGEQNTFIVLRDISSFKILNKYQIELTNTTHFKTIELFQLIEKNYVLSDGVNTAVHLRKGNSDYFILSNWKTVSRKAKQYRLRKADNKSYLLEKNTYVNTLDFKNRVYFNEETKLKKQYLSNNYIIVSIADELYWMKKSVRLNTISVNKRNKQFELRKLIDEYNDQLKTFSRAFNNANGKQYQAPYWNIIEKPKYIELTLDNRLNILTENTIMLLKDKIIENLEKLKITKDISVLANDTIQIQVR